MKKSAGTSIPIMLVVGKSIPLFSSKEAGALLCKKLSAAVIEYLSLAGIQGSPKVTVQKGKTEEHDRVLQVFVHDEQQTYSPEIIRKTWQSGSPRLLRNLTDQGEFFNHFPDSWLNNYLHSLDPEDKPSVNHCLNFLADLAFAAIMEKPSSLISKDQVKQYIGSFNDSFQVDLDFTMAVLTSLLDYGISLADTHTILEYIDQSYNLKQSNEDTSELLFARLRNPYVELIMSPKEFRILTGSKQKHGIIPVYSDKVSKELRDLIKTVEDGLFYEKGIYLPDLVWRIDPEMPPGIITFKTNDQTSQRMPLLAHDELLVNEIPDKLKQMNITPSTLMVNPYTGSSCSLVSVDHQSVLEGAGLKTWTPLGYVVLLLAGEIKLRAPHMFTVHDAVYHLDKINQYFPVLVKKILKRFSIENLTRVLRALIAERISIRNLRSILERLLQYDTVKINANNFIVFDERLPISPSSKVIHPESWQSYYEFIRSGLKRQITYMLLRGQNTISVFLLDIELEQWLMTENVTLPGSSENLEFKRNALRKAIRAEFAKNTELNPIILTTTEPRVSLRKIISREMPDVFIAAYSELTPDVNIQPVSRIYLPEELKKS